MATMDNTESPVQKFEHITKSSISETFLDQKNTPNPDDTVHFYYIMSFPFKSETPVSANLLHDQPFSCRIGRGECIEAIGLCCLQLAVGERAHFDISPKHKDFKKLVENNKWEITDSEIQENPDKVFIRIEIELIKINRNDPTTINVWNMDESERLESGQTTKNEADASFKSGNLDEALELYERSLKILIDDESESVDE